MADYLFESKIYLSHFRSVIVTRSIAQKSGQNIYG
jgi:hypothetical protein